MLVVGLLMQVAVVSQAPESVTVKLPFTVTVTVSSPAAERPELVPPRFEPFQVRDVSRRTKADTTTGWVSWKSTEWKFTLVPPPAGEYVIPAFQARSGRAVAYSLPRRVVVLEDQPRSADPAIVARAPLDTSQGVGFHALVLPETVWVGQQATYQVGVFLEDAVRLRLRRNPEFVPPELRAMLAYDLPMRRTGPSVRRVGYKRYEVHVFERALFPLSPGRYEIPPARLIYSVPLSSSFFSREESRTDRSETRIVVAREAPAEGRPAGWNGAVGALALRARLDSASARVGDPLLLTVAVSGRGNVKLLPRPAVDVPWATVVPADERVHVDTMPSVVQGVKEFDYLVTPRAAGAQEFPGVRYPVFNPYTERYEVLATAPDSLVVGEGALASADSTPHAVAPLLPLRPALRDPAPPGPHERWWFWLVAALAPVPAGVVAAARRPRRERLVTPPQRLRALARGKGQPSPALLRKTYARAVADRLGLSAAQLTERDTLAHAMRRAGVTRETARDASSFLAELNEQAWAGREHASDEAAGRALALFERVDVEARRDPTLPLPRAARAILVGALLGPVAGVLAATAWARTDAADTESFARGASLYAARRPAEAARLFAGVASHLPDAPDAWANAGTAAWSAGDTTDAVVGWQRALRLEPTAIDMRERLALVAAPEPPLETSVPPVSVGAAAVAALVAWCLAWALAALRRRSLSVAGLVAAGAGLALAVLANEAAAAKGVVVLDGGTLRDAPALGAEAVPGEVPRGVVARRTRERGAWSHVVLGDGREGWIAADAVRELAR